MEENTVYDQNVEVLDENQDPEVEVGSGNSFNAGVAAIGAAVLGGLIAGGIALGKKIKKNKAAKTEAAEAEEPKPEAKTKGLKLGKKRIVLIDERSAVPAEETAEN